MNKVSPLIVLVKNIHCQTERSQYNEAILQAAAESILAGGGVLKPLVLKRRGFEEYDLVDGEFEYFAALKAYELNPIQGESIDAYVIEPSNQAVIMQQLQLFRQRTTTPAMPTTVTTGITAEQLITLLQPLFSQLEDRLEQRLQGFEQQLQQLTLTPTAPAAIVAPVKPQPEAAPTELEAQPEAVTPPAAAPTPPPVAEQPPKAAPPSAPAPIPTGPAWLHLFNTMPENSLAVEIERAKLGVRQSVKTHLVNDRPFSDTQAIEAIKYMGGSSVKVLKAHFTALFEKTNAPPAESAAISNTPEVAANAPPVAALTPTTTAKPTPPAAMNQVSDPYLHVLNTEDQKELVFKLSRAKLTQEAIHTIFSRRPFNSLKEVEKIKGVGKTKLKNLQKALLQ